MSRRRRRAEATVAEAREATAEVRRLLAELEREVAHLSSVLLDALGGHHDA